MESKFKVLLLESLIVKLLTVKLPSLSKLNLSFVLVIQVVLILLASISKPVLDIVK